MSGNMRGIVLVFALAVSMARLCTCATTQAHHVVGGDRGWDISSNVRDWSSGKAFRIGDKIWFTYSAALESVAELRNKKEFESCDISNPIRMYTGGLDSVSLDGQGSRYFASGTPESCYSGLKLHVEVLPLVVETENQKPLESSEKPTIAAAATGPTPSISAPLLGVSVMLCLVLALLCFIGFSSV